MAENSSHGHGNYNTAKASQLHDALLYSRSVCFFPPLPTILQLCGLHKLNTAAKLHNLKAFRL